MKTFNQEWKKLYTTQKPDRQTIWGYWYIGKYVLNIISWIKLQIYKRNWVSNRQNTNRYFQNERELAFDRSKHFFLSLSEKERKELVRLRDKLNKVIVKKKKTGPAKYMVCFYADGAILTSSNSITKIKKQK